MKKSKKSVIKQYADGGRSQAPNRIKDANACSVNALANTTGMPYSVAHEIASAAGRPKGNGWYPCLILGHAKTYGIRHKRIAQKSLTLRRFVETYPRGKYYVVSTDHAFAVVDGVVLDWKRNGPQTRLLEVYKIQGSYNGKPIKELQGIKVLLRYLD